MDVGQSDEGDGVDDFENFNDGGRQEDDEQ